MLESGHLSHVGLRRDLNEDTYHGDNQLGLWLIADGMGGQGGGERASALARETVVAEVSKGSALVAAILRADDKIRQASQRCHDSLPIGSTIVAARVQQESYEIAWVGDSRAYLWEHGRLLRVRQAPRPGALTTPAPGAEPAPERPQPQRNVATHTLGITDPSLLSVATTQGELQPGMQLLLCSDGLTEQVNDRTLAAILADTACSAQESVDRLVAAALESGGNDNITVVLVRCH